MGTGHRGMGIVVVVAFLGLADLPAPAAAASASHTLPWVAMGFEDPGDAAGWSGYATSRAPDLRGFLGTFASQTATLLLAGLPAHQSIVVEFDLLVIGSWDGNGGSGESADTFRAVADGGTLLDATFSNDPTRTQKYPLGSAFPSPARSYAAEVENLGYAVNDTIYRIRVESAHVAPTLSLAFLAELSNAGDDERWGIDDLRVVLRSDAPVPAVLEVAPARAVVEVGKALQLVANVTLDDGTRSTAFPPTWTVDAPGANVSAAGVFVADRGGVWRVTAAIGAVRASALVATPPLPPPPPPPPPVPTTIVVEGAPNGTILPQSGSVRLTARVFDASGVEIPGPHPTLEWRGWHCWSRPPSLGYSGDSGCDPYVRGRGETLDIDVSRPVRVALTAVLGKAAKGVGFDVNDPQPASLVLFGGIPTSVAAGSRLDAAIASGDPLEPGVTHLDPSRARVEWSSDAPDGTFFPDLDGWRFRTAYLGGWNVTARFGSLNATTTVAFAVCDFGTPGASEITIVDSLGTRCAAPGDGVPANGVSGFHGRVEFAGLPEGHQIALSVWRPGQGLPETIWVPHGPRGAEFVVVPAALELGEFHILAETYDAGDPDWSNDDRFLEADVFFTAVAPAPTRVDVLAYETRAGPSSPWQAGGSLSANREARYRIAVVDQGGVALRDGTRWSLPISVDGADVGTLTYDARRDGTGATEILLSVVDTTVTTQARASARPPSPSVNRVVATPTVKPLLDAAPKDPVFVPPLDAEPERRTLVVRAAGMPETRVTNPAILKGQTPCCVVRGTGLAELSITTFAVVPEHCCEPAIQTLRFGGVRVRDAPEELAAPISRDEVAMLALAGTGVRSVQEGRALETASNLDLAPRPSGVAPRSLDTRAALLRPPTPRDPGAEPATLGETIALLASGAGVAPHAGPWPTGYVDAARARGLLPADLPVDGALDRPVSRDLAYALADSIFLRAVDGTGRNVYQRLGGGVPPSWASGAALVVRRAGADADLEWPTAKGAAAYLVFREGALLAVLDAETTRFLAEGGGKAFRVDAIDAAGNWNRTGLAFASASASGAGAREAPGLPVLGVAGLVALAAVLSRRRT